MINILTLEEIKNSLKNIKQKHIIQKTKLSRTTIKNLSKGIRKNYKIKTIVAISEFIDKINNKKDFFS